MLTSLLLVLSTIAIAHSQDKPPTIILDGFVRTTSGEPISYATIRLQESRYALTDNDGYFRFSLGDGSAYREFSLEAKFLGYETYKTQLSLPNGQDSLRHNITLREQNLYLNEITVSARTSEDNPSNSTYVLDRLAIEQSQANSLGELLQLIPGQSISNSNLQGAQSINFRSAVPSQYSLNNSFGISLYINDASINNNANMQALNPVTNGTFRSFGSTRIGTNSFSTGDAPGGGFDLRSLPVGDIEEIQVVQGVASARYGDILEGGIFIETIAGRSPWNINARRAGGNTTFGVNKGVQLSKNHAMNVSMDYLYSNADPRDRVKAYNRLNGSLLWTSYWGPNRQVKNTLSLSYRTNLDDYKIDPDFGIEQRVYYQNTGISVSNRTSITSNTWLFKNLSMTISGSQGKSESYLDQFVNPGVLPVTGEINEGVHEGTYHPSNYRAYREIIGEPVTFSARLQFSRPIQTKTDWHHVITYGANTSFDANYGDGRVFDPLRPIRFGGATTSERPVSYRELNPEVWQAGAYVEASSAGKLLKRDVNLSLGLRGDLQNGYESLSPRLNGRVELVDGLSLTAGYGIQMKSPGLIHLYPGPDYEDYTLLNSYTGSTGQSIYLVYTRVSRDISEDLKPMRSDRAEVGLQYNSENIRVNATVFRNVSRNGITIQNEPAYLDLPVYEIVDRPSGQAPVYRETGEIDRVIYSQGRIVNSLYTQNTGVELILSTPRFESIRTSFSLNMSYVSSYYFNRAGNFNFSGRDPQPEEEIWYGLYPGSRSRSGRAGALLTSMHHLPELGLLLTFRTEAFIYNFSEVLAGTNRATAYVNNQLEIIPIPEDQIDDPRYDILDQAPIDGSFTRDPSFVYFNMHASAGKNISRQVRLSFFANNFLNIRPEVVDREGNVTRTLNQEPYFGMELRITL